MQRRFQLTRVTYEFLRRAPGLLVKGTFRASAVLLLVAVRGAPFPGKALAVVAAWLGALSYVRSRTALERIHCVTYVSVVTLGALVPAAVATEGITPRTCKLGLLWMINLTVGALLSHATARTIHLRGGEMR